MSEAEDDPTEIFRLKELVEENYPETDPIWKAFGRIEVKTGVDIEEATEDSSLEDLIEESKAENVDVSFDDLVEAAEEVTGAEFDFGQDAEVTAL